LEHPADTHRQPQQPDRRPPGCLIRTANLGSYRKTKQGAYMTEAAAKAAGDRLSHGKVCF
jgi:hypothetical protein